jgi:hypothetical protein
MKSQFHVFTFSEHFFFLVQTEAKYKKIYYEYFNLPEFALI